MSVGSHPCLDANTAGHQRHKHGNLHGDLPGKKFLLVPMGLPGRSESHSLKPCFVESLHSQDCNNVQGPAQWQEGRTGDPPERSHAAAAHLLHRSRGLLGPCVAPHESEVCHSADQVEQALALSIRGCFRCAETVLSSDGCFIPYRDRRFTYLN